MEKFGNEFQTEKRIEPCTKNPLRTETNIRIGETLASQSVSSIPKTGSKVNNNRLVLNVGGYRFEIVKENLLRYPDTLLGGDRKVYFFDKEKKEYFFDRDPIMFKYILDFYRTGEFHISTPDCMEAISDELAFFGIPKEFVSGCCCENIDFENKHEERQEEDKESLEAHGKKEKFYEFLTDTKSSFAAAMFSHFFVLVIVVNICMINVETLQCSIVEKCGEYYKLSFFCVDSFCVAVFTFEFFARLYSCPNRTEFLKDGSNIVDLIGIVPYYIGIVERIVKSDSIVLQSMITGLRIFRIFRVTKLARHSERFMSLLRSIREAAGELGGILFSFLALMIMFSTVIYFVENKMTDKPGGFSSIPAAFWYTLVTMTTLGYGDIVPSTFIGKLIGSMCALIGVLLLALPVPIIEEKLNSNNKKQTRKREKQPAKNMITKLAASLASINRVRDRIIKRKDPMTSVTSQGSTSTIGMETSCGNNNNDNDISFDNQKLTQTSQNSSSQTVIEMEVQIHREYSGNSVKKSSKRGCKSPSSKATKNNASNSSGSGRKNNMSSVSCNNICTEKEGTPNGIVECGTSSQDGFTSGVGHQRGTYKMCSDSQECIYDSCVENGTSVQPINQLTLSDSLILAKYVGEDAMAQECDVTVSRQ